jgi:hypothetical protein
VGDPGGGVPQGRRVEWSFRSTLRGFAGQADCARGDRTERCVRPRRADADEGGRCAARRGGDRARGLRGRRGGASHARQARGLRVRERRPWPRHRNAHRPARIGRAAALAARQSRRCNREPARRRLQRRRATVPGARNDDPAAHRAHCRVRGRGYPGHARPRRAAEPLFQSLARDRAARGACAVARGTRRGGARDQRPGAHPVLERRAHAVPRRAGERAQPAPHVAAVRVQLRRRDACTLLPRRDGERGPRRATAQDRPGQRAGARGGTARRRRGCGGAGFQ